ncbi:hypothetical protein [Micromonospora sp. WMMD980]|uniref:hypothetical protein n=1 Tax=Micromonospora sp. WMMD980 TaxID=3016088 RepID=UPI00241744AD|nr:hypothetical protein [Micromonospora sp. WMMD980]MDG4801751.1 hypothetical protein [Micromonospora sp. WMMD980]
MDELTGCECGPCRATGPGALAIRLGMLRAGAHRRVTLAEHAAEAREVKAGRLAYLRASGASAAHLAAAERGYAKYAGYMRDGIGAGLTPDTPGRWSTPRVSTRGLA